MNKENDLRMIKSKQKLEWRSSVELNAAPWPVLLLEKDIDPIS